VSTNLEVIHIRIIKIEDKLYPANLRSIKNPPKQLYAEGNFDLLNQNGIAVVGSRKCSDYGEKTAKKFARELTQIGINVISGMAIGIDEITHSETIRNNGKTIAVLPSGLENVYPPENRILYNKILENGGLVLSEYAPKEEATSKNFLNRNRIVSGLGLCLIIIEAKYRSGTSVTARLAKEQGKKVFCVPSNLDSKYGIGTNQMIKDGAVLLTGIGDIIESYPDIKFNVIMQEHICKTKGVKKEYMDVYKYVQNRSTDIEYIYNNTNVSIGDINFKLTMLELEGFIEKLPGGFYRRI